MRKLISTILSICIILTACSVGFVFASAAGNQIPGTALTWAYENMTKTITFSGAGCIPDYENSDIYDQIGPQYPWKNVPYTKVVFGEGILGIGNYAFSCSNSLESITLPDSMTVLGEGAFYSCENLKSATIGSGIKNVPKSAFIKCDLLESVTFGNETEIIGEAAFKECSSLKTVVMPEALKEIKSEAFSSTGIEKIEFPANFETIGNKAFSYCDELTEITINDGMKSIGENAFLGCSELKNVAIPVTLETIGYHAFGYMNSSKVYSDFSITGYDDSAAKVYADENGITFDSLGGYYYGDVSEGIEWKFDKDTKTLSITGTGSMETEYSEENIPVYIQRFGDQIKKITISDGIDFISDYAFCNLGAECEVAPLPDGIAIGDYAFCNTGSAITFAGDVKSVGEKSIGQYTEEGVLVDEFVVIGERFTNVESFAKDNGFEFMLAVPTVLEGSCGENVTWKYDVDEKKLEISGSGAMNDYTVDEFPAYSKYDVKTLTVSDEITKIGDYALFGLDEIGEFEVNPFVTKIGECALGYTFNGEKEAVKIDGFTVKGYDNTLAKTYADENEFTFDSLGDYLFTSGLLGDTTWSYDEENKTLTVSGTGSTGDFDAENLPIFSDYDIEKIVIDDGVEELGENVFLNVAAKEVMVPQSVSSIKTHALGYVLGEPTEESDGYSIIEEMVIRCYEGSTVIDYAEEAGLLYDIIIVFSLPENLPMIVDSGNMLIYVYDTGMDAKEFVDACEKSEGITVTVSDEKISTGSVLSVKSGDDELEKFAYTFILNGDVNSDGVVNSSDALAILQHVVEKEPLEGNALKAGDLDADGTVNSTDALDTLQILVELIAPDSLMPTENKEVA